MKKLTTYWTIAASFFCCAFLLVSIGAVHHEEKIDDERELAVVLRFIPKVTVQNGEEVLNLELKDRGRKLYSGDTLETGKNGYAQVIFLDKSTVKVKPNSLLIVKGEAATDRKVFSTRIDLSKGEVFLEVTPRGANDFEVSTDKSLASVKGTEFGSRSDGYYWVEEGQVDITALTTGMLVSLLQNQFAQVDPDGNTIEVGDLSKEQIDDLNQQFNSLDVEFTEKTIKLKFRDANGQMREEIIKYYEKQGQ